MYGDDALATRKVFRELLGLLSDPEEQRAYARDVPIANVPAELVCQWFDDHYHATSMSFNRAFSADERRALADFNLTFESRRSQLPDTGDIQVLQSSDAWASAMSAAAHALAALGWGSKSEPRSPET